ncbi:DUF4178 domain-containing protein [Magnetococcus sp. PR-3]|uniref:DUF4178 domain-containing protein n=1 Tax=Magnetococcus sp. PR-3 TaxID=3120355 RepID=UPI002FCE2F56
MDSNHLMLLILVAGAGFYIFIQHTKRKKAVKSPQKPLVIQNVQAGGVISLRGVGPDLEDLDATILGRHTYDQDGYQWFELEGDVGSRKLWISVDEDDELEVALTLRKEPLSCLDVDEAGLQAIKQAKQGSVTFESQPFTFVETGQATFFRHGDRLPPNGEDFEYWEFHSADRQSGITVEQWGESGNIECHIYQILKASQYTVYALEGSDQL